mmetsp:Transcript_25160/g.82549  ORF Transcript_25160/g.82549 Transcript_25160/m.82549 type:complete len:304 (+) Transcript_25160:1534-2445(+)
MPITSLSEFVANGRNLHNGRALERLNHKSRVALSERPHAIEPRNRHERDEPLRVHLFAHEGVLDEVLRRKVVLHLLSDSTENVRAHLHHDRRHRSSCCAEVVRVEWVVVQRPAARHTVVPCRSNGSRCCSSLLLLLLLQLGFLLLEHEVQRLKLSLRRLKLRLNGRELGRRRLLRRVSASNGRRRRERRLHRPRRERALEAAPLRALALELALQNLRPRALRREDALDVLHETARDDRAREPRDRGRGRGFDGRVKRGPRHRRSVATAAARAARAPVRAFRAAGARRPRALLVLLYQLYLLIF